MRRLYHCPDCQPYFSETKPTALANLKTPISRLTAILDAMNEGQGINAVCRVFHVSKKSLSRWQARLSALKPALLLFALCHRFLQQVIEGDELDTRVKKTLLPTSAKAGQLCSWIGLPVSSGSEAVAAKTVNSLSGLSARSVGSSKKPEI